MKLSVHNYDARPLHIFTLRAGLLTVDLRKALADAFDHGEITYRCGRYWQGDHDRVEPRIQATKAGWDMIGEPLLAKIAPLAVKPKGQRPWDLSGIQNVYLLLRITLPYIRDGGLIKRITEDFEWMEGRWPELLGLHRYWLQVLDRSGE
jgi:hypothetical protein